MAKYFGEFRLVEVQKTFYQIPETKTAEKWRAQVPEDFEFTIKASQFVTHPAYLPTYGRSGLNIAKEDYSQYGFFRPTDVVFDAWGKTAGIARILDARIILFQCPGQFKMTKENIGNMRAFFSSIDRADLLFAWDPRGEWPDQVIESLCEEFNLIHCVNPFERTSVTEGLGYFRMPTPGFEYHRFSDEELEQLLAERQKHENAYVLFGHSMYQDALRFRDLVKGTERG
jgi:uncharacterized protein YecE (DUF72 family)